MNTKYCINSEKVLDLTAFKPSERDIVYIRSDSMHHNSGYRGRGGGGGHYNGHRPHNSELSLRDFYQLHCQSTLFSCFPNNMVPFCTLEMRPLPLQTSTRRPEEGSSAGRTPPAMTCPTVWPAWTPSEMASLNLLCFFIYPPSCTFKASLMLNARCLYNIFLPLHLNF